MTISFFNSWQLWEKMTFVLGCAIVLVFCVGYVKLLWTNRLVKKQEIVDEEKRMKIQELRRSGQEIESRQSVDIPFGVRAIQSGIQVDGIWISGSNTPVPSINLQRHSSYEPSSPDSISNAYGSIDSLHQPAKTPSPRPGRPGYRHSESVLSNYRNVSDDDATTSDPRSSSRQRATYKPTRSSQLRFGTVKEQQYDEETLGHLEGGGPSGRVYTHRPRGARNESDSSSSDAAAAADNERSSGTSDESDATFSNSKRQQPDRTPYASHYPSRTPTPDISSPMLPQSSLQHPTKGKGQYFSIPLTAEDEDVNPFTTPRLSPTDGPAHHLPAIDDPRAQDHFIESQASLLNERSHSQFIPGELHLNQAVRKVNSGFEVLPAGTFGSRPDIKGKGISRNDSWNLEESEERRSHSHKLQKKRAFSTTSGQN